MWYEAMQTHLMWKGPHKSCQNGLKRPPWRKHVSWPFSPLVGTSSVVWMARPMAALNDLPITTSHAAQHSTAQHSTLHHSTAQHSKAP